MHDNTRSDGTPSPMAAAAQLVVKNGVGIGVLTEPARQLALALVWAGLPRVDMSEPQVNQVLKGILADAMQCLDTDHVELRRWLVDGGWLQRDGYGRVYQRRAPDQLPPPQQALATALIRGLAGADVATWSRQQREHLASKREHRRQSWLKHQAPQSGATP